MQRHVLEEAFRGVLEREIQGTLGRVLIFRNPPQTSPERLAVKTVAPSTVKHRTAYEALGRFSREIRHWISYRHHPCILTPFFTKIAGGWPYIAMRFCEATLRDYIAAAIPTKGTAEGIAIMAQVSEALIYATSRGLRAHQDLKPENVLLQSIPAQFPEMRDNYPFIWRPRVADFGLANAYIEMGVRWGSRPYLAPEQYEEGSDLYRVDVFACGVMIHEVLTGVHPIGVPTSAVWPEPAADQSPQWRHEKRWKRWASQANQLTPESRVRLGYAAEIVEAALRPGPRDRPSLVEMRENLLDMLRGSDPNAYSQLSVLLKYFDSLCRESEGYPEDDKRYQQRQIDLLLKSELQ